MGIQFFGEFLIDRWVITRGQLLEALELQEYRNTKFGELAVQRGFITPEQLQQIHERQRFEDLRFGDLAVRMGLMTQDQVRSIVTQQKNNYLFLGESLLELGHLTEDILERELAIFQEEQARFSADPGGEPLGLPAGQPGAALMIACVDLTRKLFLRVSGLLVKVGPAEWLGEEAESKQDYHLSVSVPLVADVPVRYLLSVSSEVAVGLASKILGEDATRESEALVEDSVCEFCNMVCGNVAARLAQQGLEVEIGPPESHAGVPQPDEGRRAVRFGLRLAEGQAELRFLVPGGI